MKQEDPNQLRHNGTDALTELEVRAYLPALFPMLI